MLKPVTASSSATLDAALDCGPVERGADPPHQLEAVERGHHDVAEHEVDVREIHAGNGRRVIDAGNVVAVAPEDPCQRVENRALIVYRQNYRHRRLLLSGGIIPVRSLAAHMPRARTMGTSSAAQGE